jgi:hypothetical protein
MTLNFSAGELGRIPRACSAIRIGPCTPPYLQLFLELRLWPSDPILAARVAALRPGEMDELRRKLRAIQRGGLPASRVDAQGHPMTPLRDAVPAQAVRTSSG